MKQFKIAILFLILLMPIKQGLQPRSVHRKHNSTATIEVKWNDEDKIYKLTDSHLRAFPLFKTYNHEYNMSKYFPKGKIYYRYDQNQSIDSEELEKIIERFLQELNDNKKEFTDFKVLKEKDYNRFNKTGLIVVKFKNYPFVFKLFCESPEQFTKPYSKAFQVRGVFIMGGSFRHLTGFTRLKNLELIENKIKDNAYWSKKVTFPRKWFWLPKNVRWLEITGKNLGNKNENYIKIPGIYGIICDEIVSNKETDQKELENFREEYFKLCKFLEYQLDAYPNNFKIEGNKIALIDTEHFITLVGIQKQTNPPENYYQWYYAIASKFLKERFGSSKKDRLLRQLSEKTDYPLFTD